MSPPQLTMEKPIIFEQDEVPKKRSNKKTCIIASTVLLVVVIAAATTFGAIAYNNHLFYKEKYNTRARVDGLEFPEHIRVDYKNEIIYVTNEQSGHIDALNALHNYDRKLLAFNDITANKCFIDILEDTFDEGLKRWAADAGKVRIPKKFTFEYPSEPIHPDILRKFGGDVIADHCKNVTSHWVIRDKPVVENGRTKRVVGPPEPPVIFCCYPQKSGRPFPPFPTFPMDIEIANQELVEPEPLDIENMQELAEPEPLDIEKNLIG